MSDLFYKINDPSFDDWPELYDLLAKSFAFMEGRIDPPSSFTKLTPALLAEKSEHEALLVVHSKTKLVACGFFNLVEDAVYVGKIAVDEKWRRHGITREILRRANDFAMQNGRKWLELQVRIELVENVLTFKKLGFEKFREDCHSGYSRVTSITMRKSVV